MSLLTRRIGFQISIVEIEPKEVGWRDIAKAIGTFAAVHLRKEDLVFEPPDDSSFRILLPNTSIEEAKLIEALLQEKTTEELQRSNIETALMTAVYTVAPGASAARELPKPVLYA